MQKMIPLDEGEPKNMGIEIPSNLKEAFKAVVKGKLNLCIYSEITGFVRAYIAAYDQAVKSGVDIKRRQPAQIYVSFESPLTLAAGASNNAESPEETG